MRGENGRRGREFGTIVFILSIVFACSEESGPGQSRATFPKDKPQSLDDQTISILLEDMSDFSKAVKKLNQQRLQEIDSKYQGVLFQMEQKPLLLNSYADPAGGRVIFVVVPKDPATGASYLMTFDRDFPVIKEPTVEIQLRTPNPEEPLQCSTPVADPAEYLSGNNEHNFTIRFILRKRFLQSGTYDFDALTVPSYRTRGYAFIVFDLEKAELKDLDANLTAECRF